MRITKETAAPAQSTIFPPETTSPSTEQGEETGTALALIRTQPAALIYAPGVLAGLVERIKSEVRRELATLDVSRPKDKARIISLAANVASAKVSLDDAGKTLGEEARKQIDAINADRKWMREVLDPFKIEVRKPVTDLSLTHGVTEEKRHIWNQRFSGCVLNKQIANLLAVART